MAVFTDISDADAAELVSRYDIGAFDRLIPIMQGVENTNYHLFTDTGRFILTLFDGRTDLSALPFYFSAMDHWRHRGVTCPHVLADRHGIFVQRVADQPAAILSFLSGRGVEPGDITPALCGQMGMLMARMHMAGRDFDLSRENTVSVGYWREIAGKCMARADEIEPGLAAMMAAELQEVQAVRPLMMALPRGLIHADIFPDNIFINDVAQICGVIDFYFSCTDAYLYDLAIAVNAWCFDTTDHFEGVRFAALVRGYQSQRALGAGEIAAWPRVVRAASLRFLLSRLHDMLFPRTGAQIMLKDPREYIARLRFHCDHPDMLERVLTHGLAGAGGLT